MEDNAIIFGTIAALFAVIVMYKHVGMRNIKRCYASMLSKEYWTDYNIIEAISWTTKAIIIVPGLVFGIQIWWLYFLTLCTSLALIWASNKKLLPTLVGFNTLWVWISCIVLMKHLI